MHGATGSQFADSLGADRTLDLTRRLVVRFGAVMVGLNLALPLGLWVVAGMNGEPFWTYLEGEDNAVTWFSSVQLLLVGFAAYLNALAGATCRPESRWRAGWIWLVFTGGFVVLGIDERFSLHERLRDEVVAPADRFTGISFLEPGDIGLYVVFLVGLVFTLFLLGELRRHPPARSLFLLALTLSLVIVVMDSLRGEIAYNLPLASFWNYVFEEIGELWAQLLFLLSFLVVLRGRLATPAEGSLRREVRIAGAIVVALGVAVPLALVGIASASAVDPVRLFDDPRNPLAWLSSVQLLLLALVATLNRHTTRVGRGAWLAFAAGFVFLALDERFEIHEALREGWLEPAGLFRGTWIETGDVGLHLYWLVGLACSWFLIAPLRRCPPAFRWFVGALAASLALVVVGGLDHSIVRNWPAPESWDSTFDAVGKVWTQDLFLVAFLIVLDRQLARLASVTPGRRESCARL